MDEACKENNAPSDCRYPFYRYLVGRFPSLAWLSYDASVRSRKSLLGNFSMERIDEFHLRWPMGFVAEAHVCIQFAE